MTYEEFETRYQYDPQRDFLARGGFGAVYKAYDTIRKRYVAIKEADVDLSHKFSLMREVELSHEIDPHDNVVRYTNSYRFQLGRKQTDYALMPYFEYGNLNQVLAHQVLTNTDRKAIAKGMLQGIAHLHRQGVIHRDLKASNILMEFRDQNWVPKLTDFGLSKLVDTSASLSNTQIGLSILYAAPEQLRNETILPNVDLWAIGVSLYKVVMGKLPFDPLAVGKEAATPTRDFDTSIVAGLINRGLTAEQAAQIPYPFRAIIEQCLVVDKYQRVKTAEELLPLLDQPEPVDTLAIAVPEPLLTEPRAWAPLPSAEPVAVPDLEPSVEDLAQIRLTVRRLTVSDTAVVTTLNLAGAAYFSRLVLQGQFSTPEGLVTDWINQPVAHNGELDVVIPYPPTLRAGRIRFQLSLGAGIMDQETGTLRLLVDTDWYDWQRPELVAALPSPPPIPVTGESLSDSTDPTRRSAGKHQLPEMVRRKPWLIVLVVLLTTVIGYYLADAVFSTSAGSPPEVETTPRVGTNTEDEIATAGAYRYGVAEVTTVGGRKRYRTTQGQLFDEIRAAHCGRIPARLGNLWCYLNLNGEVAINLHYADAQAFEEGTCSALVTADGNVYRIDRWGETIK